MRTGELIYFLFFVFNFSIFVLWLESFSPLLDPLALLAVGISKDVEAFFGRVWGGKGLIGDRDFEKE